ncbi:MAG: 50S ribosomal protein L23 [Holosporales bacterium]
MENKFKLKDYDVIRRPVITEKSQQSGKFVFEVAMTSTKADIKRAVSEVFGVEVKSVNTLIRKGKTRRFKGRLGVQSDKKIAMVTLDAGQLIELGAGA